VPEGDTIYRAAKTLHRALAGRPVARFESVYPALTRIDAAAPVAGRTIDSVTSRGKHLLIAFSGDLILHTHMRMNGSWHIYKTGERWRAPRREMRIVIATEPYVAVGFSIPLAEFLTGHQLARHSVIQSLGPDLADPLFDRHEALRRIKAHPSDAIADVLLDQRVLSGTGNVLKSETLFVAGIEPFTPVDDLSDEELDRLLDTALRLMKMNITDSPGLTPAPGRRTTGSLDWRAQLFVYGRSGLACRRCGTMIVGRKSGTDARLTFWCPGCQPESRRQRP
jgi:endonuclease-8